MNMHITDTTAQRAAPQSVGRIIAILESLSNSADGSTLAELATDTAAPKTSLVGLLSGLTAEGCLVRDETGRYLLGPRFISLAMQAVAGRELIALARPVLTELMNRTGETAVLGGLAPDADLAYYLDKVESQNPIRYAVTVGERRELYCTVIGKVLLAHMDAARRDAYVAAARLDRHTPTTITSKKALKAELTLIRDAGIARTDGERFDGASGVAAPVFGADGRLAVAILIAGPSERMRANALTNEQCVRDAAREFTRLAGGRMPDKNKT